MKLHLRTFNRFLAGYRWKFYLGLSLAVVDAVCQASVPLFFKAILEGLEKGPARYMAENFWPTVWLAIGVIVVFFPAAYFFHVFTTVGASVFVRNLQVRLNEHINRLSADFFHRQQVGEITARLNTDVEVLNQGVGPLNGLVWSSVLVAYSVGMMLWISVPLTGLFAVLAIVVGVVSYFFLPEVKRMNRRVRDASGRVTAMITEYLGVNVLIRSYSREDYVQREVEAKSDEVLRERVRLMYLQHLMTDVLQVLIRFVGPLGLLFVGAQLLEGGSITTGELVAFWGFWMLVGGYLSMIIGMTASFFSVLSAADRIVDFFRETPRIRDREGAPPLRVEGGEIRLEGVSFRYPGDRGGPVLKDVSLTISPGEKIALVGPSGAGKSTLLQLLLRFYDPDEGRVSIDGQDVREVQVHSLRSQIGVVLQESLFFSGTVAENLRLAAPYANESQMWKALEAANAKEFILQMSDGLQTQLGERGLKLSGGQKQRLSIARVFLKDPRIILLDEATSALDSRSESLVKDALDRLMKGRTSIAVAHRLSTVRDADRIIVMEKGEITAMGPHEKLLQESPLYAELHATQALG